MTEAVDGAQLHQRRNTAIHCEKAATMETINMSTTQQWSPSRTESIDEGQSLTGLFTCLACQIGFHTAELQRQHYRTDWHRYNLKRKMAELPAVSAEVFQQKVIAQQQQLKLDAAQADYSQVCIPCKKTFSSENAYINHLSSRRHRLSSMKFSARHDDAASVAESMVSSTISYPMTDSVASLDEIRTLQGQVEQMNLVEEEEEDTDQTLPPEICLFCLNPSPTFDDNVLHMARAHGLFIPEREFLVDLRGLIIYLGEKITVGNICIYCDKGFTSAEGTRAHMLDKGHCKIPYSSSTEIQEYSEFYDFSSSYPQADAVDDDNDSEWSDDPDSDASSIASEDLKPVQISHDMLELRLPHVGKRLGHRSLARYYRQNLRPEKAVSQGEQTHRLMIEGPAGFTKGVVGVRKFGERSMMVEVSKRRKAEREARRFRDHRKKDEFRTEVAFRKTAEFKKYYRDPLLQ